MVCTLIDNEEASSQWSEMMWTSRGRGYQPKPQKRHKNRISEFFHYTLKETKKTKSHVFASSLTASNTKRANCSWYDYINFCFSAIVTCRMIRNTTQTAVINIFKILIL